MLYSYVLLCELRFTYIVHRTCIFLRWILDSKYILLLILLLLLAYLCWIKIKHIAICAFNNIMKQDIVMISPLKNL